jgi:hypothetical protein
MAFVKTAPSSTSRLRPARKSGLNRTRYSARIWSTAMKTTRRGFGAAGADAGSAPSPGEAACAARSAATSAARASDRIGVGRRRRVIEVSEGGRQSYKGSSRLAQSIGALLFSLVGPLL